MRNRQLWLESQIFHVWLYGKNVKDPVCFHSQGPEWSGPTPVPHCRLLAVNRAKHNHKRNSLRTRTEPSLNLSLHASEVLHEPFIPCSKGLKKRLVQKLTPIPTCHCWYILSNTGPIDTLGRTKPGRSASEKRWQEKGPESKEKFSHYTCWVKMEYFNTCSPLVESKNSTKLLPPFLSERFSFPGTETDLTEGRRCFLW